LGLQTCCPWSHSNTEQVGRKSGRPSIATIHGLFPLNVLGTGQKAARMHARTILLAREYSVGFLGASGKMDKKTVICCDGTER
jgi:hypothetical protein